MSFEARSESVAFTRKEARAAILIDRRPGSVYVVLSIGTVGPYPTYSCRVVADTIIVEMGRRQTFLYVIRNVTYVSYDINEIT
jgi:hypothetical protein